MKECNFYSDDAEKHGVCGAILLQHIRETAVEHKHKGENYHDEKTWVCDSATEISNKYPFMSAHQVRRGLGQLVAAGALCVGNYNRTAWDRTRWFSLSERS